MIKADKYPPELKMQHSGEYALFDVNSYNEISALVKQIVDFGGRVYHVTACKHSLEEIYFALLGKKETA